MGDKLEQRLALPRRGLYSAVIGPSVGEAKQARLEKARAAVAEISLSEENDEEISHGLEMAKREISDVPISFRDGRERLGWTVSDLAKAIGLDPKTAKRYDEGEKRAPEYILMALAWWLTLDGEPNRVRFAQEEKV